MKEIGLRESQYFRSPSTYSLFRVARGRSDRPNKAQMDRIQRDQSMGVQLIFRTFCLSRIANVRQDLDPASKLVDTGHSKMGSMEMPGYSKCSSTIARTPGVPRVGIRRGPKKHHSREAERGRRMEIRLGTHVTELTGASCLGDSCDVQAPIKNYWGLFLGGATGAHTGSIQLNGSPVEAGLLFTWYQHGRLKLYAGSLRPKCLSSSPMHWGRSRISY